MKSEAGKLAFLDPPRIAAAFAFLFGLFWTLIVFRKLIEHGNIHWLFLPGLAVWIAWGVIAVGCGSVRFCKYTWVFSSLWHGLLSVFCIIMVIALAGLPLIFAPLEIAWVIAIAVVSVSVIVAGVEPHPETGANKTE